jgi:hypothetical protein
MEGALPGLPSDYEENFITFSNLNTNLDDRSEWCALRL